MIPIKPTGVVLYRGFHVFSAAEALEELRGRREVSVFLIWNTQWFVDVEPGKTRGCKILLLEHGAERELVVWRRFPLPEELLDQAFRMLCVKCGIPTEEKRLELGDPGRDHSRWKR